MAVALLQAASPTANLPYLFAAFAVSWAAFFAYVYFMARRQREMRREIAELRRALEQQEGRAGS